MKTIIENIDETTELLEKALDKSKLVPVTVQVTRKGKVFNKVVWKKASEVEAEKNKSKQMTLPKDEKPAKAQPKHDITITKDSDGVYSYTSKGEDMGLKFKSKNDLISHLADTHSHVDLPSIKSLVNDADKNGSSSTEFDTPTLRYDSDKKDFKKVQIKTTGTIKKNADGTFTFSDGAEGMDITEDSKDDLIRRMVESDRTDLATAKELVNGLKNSDTSSKTYTSTAIEFEDKQQASTDVKESSEVEKQTLDINKFDSLKKTNRPAALEYLKDCGVTWEENPHPAINLMRATMAAKGSGKPSEPANKPIPGQLAKPEKKAKVDNSSKNAEYLAGLKEKGITWEENAHPAINLMRAKMAEKKAGDTKEPPKEPVKPKEQPKEPEKVAEDSPKPSAPKRKRVSSKQAPIVSEAISKYTSIPTTSLMGDIWFKRKDAGDSFLKDVAFHINKDNKLAHIEFGNFSSGIDRSEKLSGWDSSAGSYDLNDPNVKAGVDRIKKIDKLSLKLKEAFKDTPDVEIVDRITVRRGGYNDMIAMYENNPYLKVTRNLSDEEIDNVIKIVTSLK